MSSWTVFRRLAGTRELTQVKDRCEFRLQEMSKGLAFCVSHLFLNLARWADLQSDYLLTFTSIFKTAIFRECSHAVCIRWQMSCSREGWRKLRDWPMAGRRQAAPRRSSLPAAGLDWSAPNALASWLTLAIRVGTAWHALVCTGVLQSPGTASGLRALMTLSSARGSLPLFPAVLQISSKEPV